MTASNDDDVPYEVGYRRPPVATRFRPGQSGNPKGRRKGIKNFATEVAEILRTPVPVTQNGKRRYVSGTRAVLLKELERALKGDARAADRLLARAERFAAAAEPSTRGLALPDEDMSILEGYVAELKRRGSR